MSKLSLGDENDAETQQGVQLLKAVLKYETQVGFRFSFFKQSDLRVIKLRLRYQGSVVLSFIFIHLSYTCLIGLMARLY